MALYFGKATRVFFRTLPFVALRAAVGVLFGLAAVAYFGTVGWLAITLSETGTVSGPIGGIGLLVATLVFLAAVRFARRYVLYMVAAGHIAVIAHVVETGETPPNQIAFGTAAVRGSFAEANALFAVDRTIKAALAQFNGAAVPFSRLVRFVPALESVLTVLRKALSLAASYLDEAILAYVFLNGGEDDWRAARDGVVLYAKTWRSVLGSTLLIVLGLYAVAFVLLLSLTPLAAVFGGLSPTFEVLGWIAAAGVAVALYLGVLRPWVKTVVITTFLVESRELTPDGDTMALIAGRSRAFGELVANADADRPDERPLDDGGEYLDEGRSPG